MFENLTFDAVGFWVLALPFIGIYWVLPHQFRKFALIIFGYGFYSTFDWRFLIPLIVSTVCDFFLAPLMQKDRSTSVRRAALAASLGVNLGLLIVFKYLHSSLTQVGWSVGIPIGISFYTFQTLSYSFDVYLGRMKPTRSIVDFANYVAFFPQLMAGPIERARKLLPQLVEKRELDSKCAAEGFDLISLGLFKKILIAGSLVHFVEAAFNTNGASIYLIGVAGFAMTLLVYADFSGYSDIARGLAKLLGIELMINFRPFLLVRNIGEFWQRWHLSLTNWIRDYIFIGLRLHKGSEARRSLGTLLVFVLIGIWHAAEWNWVLFGLFHGLCFLAFRYYKKWGGPRLPFVVCLLIMWFVYVVGGALHAFETGANVGSFWQNLNLSFWSQAVLSALKYVGFYGVILAVIESVHQWLDLNSNSELKSWGKVVLHGLIWALILGLERQTSFGFVYFDF